MRDSQAMARVRPDIITDQFLATLRQYGMAKAYLFGGVSRHEERPDSDVDLLVTFDHDVTYGERFLLTEELHRICARPVDLLTDIHPAFAPISCRP